MHTRSRTSRAIAVVGFWALYVSLIGGGCAQKSTAHRVSFVSAAEFQSEFTAEQREHLERNCGPWGMPVKTQTLGPTRYATQSGYVLEHSSLDRIPIWVAELVEADRPDDGTGRPPASKWTEEDRFGASERAELSDYRGSGMDRGHMAPNGDFGLWDLKVETFRLSNAVPQNANQNQQIWRELEQHVRDVVDDRGLAYILTGPLFYEEEEDPELAGDGDGLIEYETIGANRVAVPTHTYKIVITPVAPGADEWETFALVVPNARQSRPFDWASYAKSIDWIEAWTGLDFLPALSGGIQEALLERDATPAPW